MSNKEIEKPRVIDLFCGVGGFSEGFKKAGYEIVFGFDKCEQARMNYEVNIGAPCTSGDLRDPQYQPEYILDNIGYSPGEIDVVIGGPPCQGFSLAGKMRKGDERNYLYKQFLNFISYCRPKIFVMENVPAIRSHDEGAIFEDIKNYFNPGKKNPNYKLNCRKLNAVNFGVPQTRERFFIVGSLENDASFPPRDTHYYNKKDINSSPPDGLKPFVSVYQAISDLLLNGTKGENISEYSREPESIYQKERRTGSLQLYNHVGSNHTDPVIERFSRFKEGDTVNDLPVEFRTNKMIVKRLHRSFPSPTIMTLPDDLIHYQENRILSVREMARIQSFDDKFHFHGKRTTGGGLRKNECPQYTLVGNAVPPLLSKAIARELLNSPVLRK